MARTSLSQTSCLDLLKAMVDLGKLDGGAIVAAMNIVLYQLGDNIDFIAFN